MCGQSDIFVQETNTLFIKYGLIWAQVTVKTFIYKITHLQLPKNPEMWVMAADNSTLPSQV